MPKPNILWITCEDISPHLGVYGDSYAYTPNIDHLASEGVFFTHAYASASVCTPARSSIITGLYASSLGTQHLRGITPLDPSVKCFTEILRKAGYYCSNNVKEDYNFTTPSDAWDDSSDKAHWRNRSENQPFFSVFNFTLTHQSQTRYEKDVLLERNQALEKQARHDSEGVPVPPYYPNTQEVRNNLAALYTQITLLDVEVQKILDQLEQDGLTENTIVFFYSDHGDGLPRHKRWLHHSGTKVPLIIKVPKKYQHLAVATPGAKSTSIVNFVDLAPTLLTLAGLEVPENMPGKVFLGPDREPREYTFAIRDRVDEVFEFSRAVSDSQFQYIRNFAPHKPRMQWSDYSELTPIRKELRRLHRQDSLNKQTGWLMTSSKPAEELYDLANDPHQMVNLAQLPQSQGKLQEMKRVLFQWMVETRDLSLMPEPLMRSLAYNYSPRVTLAGDDLFPIEKILKTADLIGRGPKHLDELTVKLSDSSPAVRYWAAVGLMVLGPDAKGAVPQLESLLVDEHKAVRIAGAEAMAVVTGSAEGIRTLGDLLVDEDILIRIYAGMALIDLGEKAKLVEEKVRQSAEQRSTIIEDQNYETYLKNALSRIMLNIGDSTSSS